MRFSVLFSIVGVSASLLFSAQVFACDYYVSVENDTTIPTNTLFIFAKGRIAPVGQPLCVDDLDQSAAEVYISKNYVQPYLAHQEVALWEFWKIDTHYPYVLNWNGETCSHDICTFNTKLEKV